MVHWAWVVFARMSAVFLPHSCCTLIYQALGDIGQGELVAAPAVTPSGVQHAAQKFNGLDETESAMA